MIVSQPHILASPALVILSALYYPSFLMIIVFALVQGWRKRWCVFTIIEGDPSLDYYKDEEQAFNSLPIKRISLLNCYQVISDMTHKQKKHIFALHLPKRVYYFSAPSQYVTCTLVHCHSNAGKHSSHCSTRTSTVCRNRR